MDDELAKHVKKEAKRRSGRTPREEVKHWFQCDLCWKRFQHPRSLRIHQRIHNNPFTCSVCGKRCARMSNLNAHKQSMHGIEIQTVVGVPKPKPKRVILID